jgi:hypothetical protein
MTYPSLIYEFSYEMTIYHVSDIYRERVTVIIQQYGLLEILPIFNRVDAV